MSSSNNAFLGCVVGGFTISTSSPNLLWAEFCLPCAFKQQMTTSHLTSPQHVETWHYLRNYLCIYFQRIPSLISEMGLANEKSSYTWPKQHEANCHLHVLPHSHLSFLASPYTEFRTHVRQGKHPYIHSPTIIKIIPQSHLKIQPPQGQVNSSQPQRVVSLNSRSPCWHIDIIHDIPSSTAPPC